MSEVSADRMAASEAGAGGRPREAWWPDPEQAAASNVGRFMARHGIDRFEDLVARSIDDVVWFWGAVVEFLGVPFVEPYQQVMNVDRGAPWARWFVGGRLNLAEACVDRHAAGAPGRTAVIWEGEDGEVRQWTYEELRSQADGLARMLAEHGVGEGDAVGVFMPMVPETVATLLAVAKLGAVFLPLFSGYAPHAVSTRLADAGAVALVTADGFRRRGAVVPMLDVARESVAAVPSVRTVVVAERVGNRDLGSAATDGRSWAPWPGPAGARFPSRPVDSEHPLFIGYTSGTTGRPKGSVHVHAGFGVKAAEELAFQFDCRPDDVLFWFTDIGWIMGPWKVFGGLAVGATLALYEGAPDYPGPDRLWAVLERHRVSICGVSPTLVRALMAHGDDPVTSHDLSTLRILGSTGEPWNDQPWWWYFRVVGGQRCPVVNISGGTEVGACFLSPHPVAPLKPLSLGGPALGMAVDVFDERGRPLRNAVGELVCTKPWPAMTRGLYGDPERYIDTYWSRWPGVWTHGDWASIDEDGEWFLHGRSDDTIKVAGKRLGPAEVESVLVSHPAVLEAAAIGMPDAVKGETLWAYVVLGPGWQPAEDLRAELTALVADQLGRSFRPSSIRFAAALPKTRNAKVLRRAVRAAATGAEAGDLSALEDPAAVDAVRDAR
jgi:acetyl-CoA synthetase